MAISFNTTSVSVIDNIGKLYKTAIPLSDDTSANTAEALAYSVATLAENKVAPANTIYLKNNDTENSYFSIDRTDKNLNLVASTGLLNLYVYTPSSTDNSSSLEKFSFDASNGILEQAQTTNPSGGTSLNDSLSFTNLISIANEEIVANRDLDNNGNIGAALDNTTGTLDKTGALYKVNVAGQDMFLIGGNFTGKSKSINVNATVLKVESPDIGVGEIAWQPEQAYDFYTSVKAADGNGWEVFAVRNPIDGVTTNKVITQFSFNENNLLKPGFETGKELSASQVANFEKRFGRDIDKDALFGVAITVPIDTAGGLYRASILRQDFYVVDTSGNGLKTSTKSQGAVDLSGTLVDAGGESAWQAQDGYSVKSIVQNDTHDSVQAYLTKDSDPSTVVRFDFALDVTTGNFKLDGDNIEGIQLDPIALSKAEKEYKRNLDQNFYTDEFNVQKAEFGVTIVKNLDKTGGLYQVSALGQTYLVAGKSLVSNSKNITDLTNALTIDGQAWMPEGLVASQLKSGDFNIIFQSVTAEVYVKEEEGFSKYVFTREDDATPWATTGVKTTVDAEQMAALEVTTGRDLNNDKFYGAVVVGQVNAPGGLYTAAYKINDEFSLGAMNSDAVNSAKIYLRSTTKLSIGSSVAKNAVDFSAALRSQEGFWKPPGGLRLDDPIYNITGAFSNDLGDKYHVIVTNQGNTADFRQYSFDIADDGTTQLDLSSFDISAQDLASLEVSLKRDLNRDRITGVKILETSDKVGGLFKVIGPNGNYFVSNPTSSTAVTDLRNAFFDATSNPWSPTASNGATINKLTLFQTTTGANGNDEFLIYQKETKDGQPNGYSKYTFDENHQLTGQEKLSIIDLANEESITTNRDINGDGFVGAKVTAVIDKAAGLYKVSIDNNFMLVAINPSNPPLKQISLSDVLLDENSTPLLISEIGLNILDQSGVSTGWNVRNAVRSPDEFSIKVYATKTNTNGTVDNLADDFTGVKRLTFSLSADSVDYTTYKRLSSEDILTSKELVADEALYIKDVNGDKVVGAKIKTVEDKVAGLYTTKVLGDTYYFFDTLNKKNGNGTSTTPAIDLSKAFLDSNLNAWRPTTDYVIAGLVTKKDVDSNIIGYDIFTYKKTANQSADQFEFDVRKYSWTWSDSQGLAYQEMTVADTAEMVNVERGNSRDLSGDGVVGFKLINNNPSFPGYTGVTEAKVLAGNESRFFVVGQNLKAGTPTNPWKLSDALLNQEGTGAWSIPTLILNNVTVTPSSITAVRDINDTDDRFVYVKYGATNDTAADIVMKFQFNKVTGKYTGTSETLDAVTFSAEELKFNKDLNADGKIGVTQFSDVKLGALVSSGSLGVGTGKSSGLIQAIINDVKYLVVKKAPSSNTKLNLEHALVTSTGSPWIPENNFMLSGVYKNLETNATEVYGSISGQFKKYEFTIEDMPSTTSNLETYANGTVPQVLMLRTSDEDSPITAIEIAERENVVGKDLNNDSSIGFKIDSGLPKASLANGIQLGTANSGNIYVVGKSIASMGTNASNTANQNALREMMVEGEKTYWNPPAPNSIKSIISTADAIKVYVLPPSGTLAPELDQNSLIEYTFFKDGENGKDGWLLQSELTSNVDPTAIVNLETTERRDMNGDSAVGLQTTTTGLSGLIQGSVGTTKFFFVGQTRPIGIDSTRLLTDVNGSAWRPADGETASTFRLTLSSDQDIKDAAIWTLITTNTNQYYFNSQYQQVS